MVKKDDDRSSSNIISRSRYDAVIFDLDGVITGTERLHASAWKEMFDEFLSTTGDGHFEPFDIEDDYLRYVDGKPRYAGVIDFLESRNVSLPYGSPNGPPDARTVYGLGNSKNQLFLQHLKEEGADVSHGSLEFVNVLKQSGFKTAVATSSRNCSEVMDSAGIADLFDAQVDGIDIESLDLAGKPDPDMFLEAARRLKVDPSRSIVVEDAIAGVQAGRAGDFGLVVGVGPEERAAPLLRGGADLVVRDLSELDVELEIDDLRDALDSLDEIEQIIGSRPVTVFLDYDGTLTHIVAHPEDALLPEETRSILEELSTQAPVAIISGRGLADIKEMVGLPDIYYAGSHGFEISAPDGTLKELEEARAYLPLLEEVEATLGKRLAGIEGAQVERKKYSIAVHYRNVAQDEVDLVKKTAEDVSQENPDLRRSGGKKVIELKPDIDWNKGSAVDWLLESLDGDRAGVVPLYIGDDLTDEDAFEALRTRGITIVVGEGSRGTRAQYRLKDTEEVARFLSGLNVHLGYESSWWLVFDDYIPEQEGLREALCTLGNGYFATRGAAAESRADDIHYPGTYLAGGYDRLVTEVAGRAVENEDLVNMPNWLCLSFRVLGEDWFDLDEVEILRYSQKLNMKNGVLHRSFRFRDEKARETRVSTMRLVSMADMHMAAMETVITPLNWSGVLEVRSAIDGTVTNDGVARYRAFDDRHLEPVQTREVDDRTVLLEARTSQSRISVALVAKTDVSINDETLSADRQLVIERDYIAHNVVFEVAEGDRVAIEKTIALYTSRDNAISEWTLEAERAVAYAERFHGLLRAQSIAWASLWHRFQVDLDLQEYSWLHPMQMILRLYSFHLLQSASVHSLDIDVGMPSRGWHGEAYRGHIFWDELIIFPFLNYRMPQITRTLLMYRYRRLNEARKAARNLGYKGAMFPWQSGSDGREETQQVHLNPLSGKWIPDHSQLQRHINAAIVYNIWQYYQVTGDIEFVSWYGAEMILEIARFWSSIAEYDPGTDRFEIRGVMGPDEYHDAYPGRETPGLDNNAYTNVMVTFVMNRALELFELLPEQECDELRKKLAIEEAEIERWRDMSGKMRVVFQGDGIISQFEGYGELEEFDWDAYRKEYGNIQRLDRILDAEGDTTNRYKISKQADVLMLFYLFSAEQLQALFDQLGYAFDPEMIPKNIEYYLERTSNGSSLSWIIHSWVAARADREQSWELFNIALLTDFVDIQGGTTSEGIHLGAMAGCVDMVQRGYTGLESRGDTLRFNPALPEEVGGIDMCVRYRGAWLNLRIRADLLKAEVLFGGKEPIRIEIADRVFEFDESRTLEVRL